MISSLILTSTSPLLEERLQYLSLTPLLWLIFLLLKPNLETPHLHYLPTPLIPDCRDGARDWS